MSNNIEERVVKMKFDNKDFEKNISTTMKSLEKLEDSLKFEDATDGFDKIEKASKDVDLDSIGKSIEDIDKKFSLMGVAAATVMANITQSALNAAKTLTNAFAIEPIRTGFNEYEQLMDSTRVIMSGTGESLETVTRYLDELNLYADKTIYSFSDMTQNIGKFTNAGVKLEDAVLAMKGISNEAALSGANANEASRAMYNLAQSLSMGYVQYIDWKSIENANMATVDFKKNLAQTAIELGVIRKTGDDLYNDGKKSYNLQALFKDGMKDQWLTTEVLIKTLRDYADETTDIGKRAYKAATEVTTFTKMIDTLKEAAQSGWANTWKTIVGDYNEAKELWTALSDTFSEALNMSSSNRNSFLDKVLGSNYSKVMQTLADNGLTYDALYSNLSKVVGDQYEGGLDAIIDEAGSLEKAFLTQKISINQLKEAITLAKGEVIKFSDAAKGIKLGARGEGVLEVQTALKKLGYDLGAYGENLDGLDGRLGKVTTSAIKAFQADKQLAQTGVVDEATLEALDLEANKLQGLTLNYKELEEQLTNKGGRQMIIDSMMNLITVFKKVSSSIKTSFHSVFNDDYAGMLLNTIRNFESFTIRLRENDEMVNNLTDVFTGLFSVIKMGTDILNNIRKVVWNIVKIVLPPVGRTLLNVMGIIGRLLKYVTDVARVITDTIVKSVDIWIEKFKETEAFKVLSENISTITEAVQGLFEGLQTRLSAIKFDDALDKVNKFAESMAQFFEWLVGTDEVTRAMNYLLGSTTDFVNGWTGIKWESMQEGFDKFLNYLNAHQVTSLGSALSTFFGFLGERLSFKVIDIQGKLLEKFNDGLIKYGATWDVIKKNTRKIVDKIKEFFGITDEITFDRISGIVKTVLEIAILFKTFSIVDSISETIEGFAHAALLDQIGDLVKYLAALALAVATSIKILSGIPKDNLNLAVGVFELIMVSITAIVGGFTVLSSRFGRVGLDDNADMLTMVLTVVGFALASYIAIKALKEISEMRMEDIQKGVTGLFAVLLSLVTTVAILGVAARGNSVNFVTVMSMLVALNKLPDLIEKFSSFDWAGNIKGIIAAGATMLALAGVVRVATGGIKAGANVNGSSLVLLAMVISIKLLMKEIKEIGAMPTGDVIRGVGAITATLIAMSTCIRIMNTGANITTLKKGERAISAYKGLAAVMIATTAAIYVLGNMNKESLAQGVTAVSAVMLSFAAMIKQIAILGYDQIDTKKIIAVFIAIGAIIAEIGIAVGLLAKYDWKNTLGAAAGLALAITSLGVVIAILGGLTKLHVDMKKLTQAVGVVALLGLVVGEIALFIGLLNRFGNVSNANILQQMEGISLILATMTGITLVLGTFPVSAGLALEGVLALSLVITALSGLLAGLGVFSEKFNISGKTLDKGVLIIEKLGEMIGAFYGGVIGKFVEKVSSGFYKALRNLGEGIKVFGEDMNGFFDVIRNISDSDVDRTANLIAAISEIAKIAEWNTDVWDLFQNESDLAVLGEQVSEFSKKLKPFFNNIKDAGSSTVSNAAKLVTAIGTLVTGLNNDDIKKFKAKSFDEVIKGLENITDNIPSLTDKAKDIDFDTFNSVVESALKLTEIRSKMPPSGFKTLWSGQENWEQFSTGMVEFADAMMGFSIHSKLIDEEGLQQGVKAFETLNAIRQSMPPSGIKLIWSGQENWESFTYGMGMFADSMLGFEKKMKDINVSEGNGLEKSVKAFEYLKYMRDNMPDSGIVTWFSGQENWNKFKSGLVDFGDALVRFNDKTGVSGFESEKITEHYGAALNAVRYLVTMRSYMSENDGSDGFLAWWAGKSNFTNFGNGLEKFATILSNVSGIFIGTNSTAIEKSLPAVEALVKMKELMPDGAGITQWLTNAFTGGNAVSYESLSVGLGQFGKAMKEYGQNVAGLNVDDIKSSVLAVKALVAIKQLIPGGNGLLNDIAQAFVGGGDNTANALSGFATLGEQLSQMSDALSNVHLETIEPALNIMNKLCSIAERYANTGDGSALTYFGQGVEDITNALGIFSATIGEISLDHETIVNDLVTPFITGIKKYAADGTNSFKSAGEVCALAFGNGMINANINRNSVVSSMVTPLVNLVRLYRTNFYAAGQYLMDGLIAGINSKAEELKAAAEAMASIVSSSFCAATGIASPSKLFTSYGQFIGIGLVRGIENTSQDVKNATKDMSDNAISGFNSAISAIAKAVESDLDNEPVIRPVIDMSNVQSGLSNINGSFNKLQGLNLSATINNAKGSIPVVQKSTGTSVDSAVNQNGVASNGNIVFTQNNYSPKALSRTEIYRQTNNQLSAMKEAMA